MNEIYLSINIFINYIRKYWDNVSIIIAAGIV